MNKDKDIHLIQEKMIGCGSFTWTVKHKDIMEVSHGFFEMLELEEELFTVDKFKSLILEEDFEELVENFHFNTNHQKYGFDMLFRTRTGKGRVKRVNARLRCYYDEVGGLFEVIGVLLDLSYNNQRDYSTRLNDEKFYRLFGDAPIGISLLRVDGTSFLCNDSLVDSVYYKEYELKELPFHVLIHEEDQHKFVSLYRSMVEGQIPSFRNDFRIINKRGDKVWHDITASSVHDMYDKIKYIIIMAQPSQRNASQSTRKGLLKSIRDELDDLSLRDSLSGLYNRQYALSKLRELILVFYERNLTFSTLMIDLDYINHINEKYGYECGDKIIHDLSEIFKSVTRDTDIGARWGGEEFIILFPEMDIHTATILANRLRNEVRNTILIWEGHEIQMTVSISVTAYTSDDTLKTFLNKIDKALYEDKTDIRDIVRQI